MTRFNHSIKSSKNLVFSPLNISSFYNHNFSLLKIRRKYVYNLLDGNKTCQTKQTELGLDVEILFYNLQSTILFIALCMMLS